jgi:hypothetical protein
MSGQGKTARELLERYLQAVGKQLPRRRQADILAELRANLESQLEDKETELGRELKQGEAEDWLRELGSPMQVAARYLPQQWLIGPGIFPVYWFVLRTALVWALGIYTVVAGVLIVLGQPGANSIATAIWRAPWVLLEVAAWVTLIFAALEFVSARFPGWSGGWVKEVTEWSPATLPPIEKPAPGFAPKTRWRAVADFVFGCLVLAWVALIPQFPFLLLGPGWWFVKASPFALAPTVMVFYYWVLAMNVMQVTWHGVDLARGAWRRAQPGKLLAFKAFAIIPLVVLVRAPEHQLLLLKHPLVDGAHYGGVMAAVNQGSHEGLLVVLVIVALQFVWELGRWVREARSGSVHRP